MNHTFNSHSEQRQALFALCRFLSARITYRSMLVLLSVTGLLFTVLGQTQFAPYGIALLCLLLPSFLNDSVKANKKQENREFPLSALYKRYHYSPVAFTTYRITLLLCMLLLLIWHSTQIASSRFLGMSVPLVLLALFLALYPVLSRILLFVFHRRLMNGTL
jgi:hypothetical protein